MKIIWSDFALNSLIDIYKYYKEVAGINVAVKIKRSIFQATKQLIQHPKSGQIELSLEKLKEGHRYLVNGNYKIIYKKVNEGIFNYRYI
jgi:plasmid stabilization system protein ParE